MNQSQQVICALAESNKGFGQSPERDMALVLFMDGFLSVADNEGIKDFSYGPDMLARIPDVLHSQQNAVLGFLAQKGLDVDKYLNTAMMTKIIKLVDEFWGGKLTVKDLWDEFPDSIIDMALGFSGVSVSLTYETAVESKLRAFGVGNPHAAPPVVSAISALGIEDYGYEAGVTAKNDVEGVREFKDDPEKRARLKRETDDYRERLKRAKFDHEQAMKSQKSQSK